MQAFILAGGFATRLWPLTERRAKPLLPLCGVPLMTRIAESVPEGIPITVSTNAAFADDIAVWSRRLKRTVRVTIEDAGHEDIKLGALGAVARWMRDERIEDDVLLLAGDNYADCSLADFVAQAHGHPLVAGYDIGDPERASKFGTMILDGKRVLSFEEKPAQPRSTIVSTGWSILPASCRPILLEYAARKPDDIGGIFEEFLRRGMEVEAVVQGGVWADIGSFDAYLSLHRRLVGDRQIVDDSSTCDRTTRLHGSVDIGPGCTVHESRIEDSLFFGSTEVTDCVVERCIVDEGCILRGVDLSDQMIRAGTVLSR